MGGRLCRSLCESYTSRPLYQARGHAPVGPGLICPWYEKPHHPLLQGLLSRGEAMTAHNAHRSSRGCSSGLGASGWRDRCIMSPPACHPSERKESNVQTLTWQAAVYLPQLRGPSIPVPYQDSRRRRRIKVSGRAGRTSIQSETASYSLISQRTIQGPRAVATIGVMPAFEARGVAHRLRSCYLRLDDQKFGARRAARGTDGIRRELGRSGVGCQVQCL